MSFNINNYKISPYREVITFTLPITILIILFIFGWASEGSQQFSLLAQAFIHGQLNFRAPIGGLGQDPLLYHGKIYWGEGPFPAIFLIPFVGLFNLFQVFFYQGYIKWALMLGIIYFVYSLARKLKYTKEDSLILMFGFTLGSVFIGAASTSSSWLFAQIMTTFLILWSLHEYSHRKRWWLIGIVCSLVFLTRVTAAPIFIFFGLELLNNAKVQKKRLKNFIWLSLPLALAVVLQGLYNLARFHSPFNGGYAYQLIYPDAAQSKSLGLFSIAHIPAGLYSALLRAPVPVLRTATSWTLKFPFVEYNAYGMSIFVTSPYLLYLFSQKWSLFGKRERNLVIATIASALLVFSYYGIGLQQFGYRYSLDFLPEMFLLFMIIYRKNHTTISKGMKTLLLGAGITNFYLLLTLI